LPSPAIAHSAFARLTPPPVSPAHALSCGERERTETIEPLWLEYEDPREKEGERNGEKKKRIKNRKKEKRKRKRKKDTKKKI
jgi:hypothetical protein